MKMTNDGKDKRIGEVREKNKKNHNLSIWKFMKYWI